MEMEQPESLQLLLSQHLVPIKTLKSFSKIFIIGSNPDLALTQEFFFQKNSQKFECIKIVHHSENTAFNLVLLQNQFATPIELLKDSPPSYVFKSLSVQAVNQILKKQKRSEDFVEEYLCKKLGCSHDGKWKQQQQQEFNNKKKKRPLEQSSCNNEEVEKQIEQRLAKEFEEKLQIKLQTIQCQKEKELTQAFEEKLKHQTKILQEDFILREEQLIKRLEKMVQQKEEKLIQEMRQNSAEKNREINNLKQEIKQNSAEKSHQIDMLKQEIRQKSAEKNEKIYNQNSQIEAMKKQMNLFDQKQKSLQHSHQKLVKSLLQKSEDIREKTFNSNKAEKGVFISDQMKWVIRKMDKMFTKWQQVPGIEQ